MIAAIWRRVVGVCVCALPATMTDAAPPNIVMILADDVGFGDLASYGHPYARTPSLDRLAAEGTRFTQFYVTGITCNPSRTGFMTGRYPSRFQQYTGENGFGDSLTITELLAQKGYRTGHFGKWHIGPVKESGTYGISNLRLISGRRKDPAGRDADIFSAAIKFIENNKDRPFYVNIWGHSTHSPINPIDEVLESFPKIELDRDDFGFWAQENFDKSLFLIRTHDLEDDLAMAMRKYLSDLRALDEQVGRLMAKLEDLGLNRQTIVAFSSDQGPEPVFIDQIGYDDEVQKPDRAKNLLGYAGGLRSGKHSVYEGGVRAPLIIRWPGHVKANYVNETSVMSAADWLPTVATIAGIDLGALAGNLDGEDVSDIWVGASRSRKQAIFWRTSATGSPTTMRRGDWKITKHESSFELYNLAADQLEIDDLGSKRLDVTKELVPEIVHWEATLPATYVLTRVPSPLHPTAIAGADRTLSDDDGNGYERVELDGSASTDPDGFISGYVWSLKEKKVAVGRRPNIELALGEHSITLEVTDYAKNVATDQVRIRVVP